ncbi:hypothetical protein [Streptomyces sp. NRRL S-350]|uniref:hypothetical protein n=1 Tax=Streptomyces sp. NRRL S-350 TaxID=1463902 RepID=UPI0004C22BE1|nr:hypothetical protein [Streptomyces sp. NRRL S-350]
MTTHPHREVAAHDQPATHRYTMHFPAHEPREDDPHYAAFNAYRKHHRQGAACYVGERAGHDQCAGNLELHHAVLEFAVANAADAEALHKDFPEISEHATAEEITDWAESSPGQFRWLCAFHHRGAGGAHTASHADWTAQLYVPGLISR